MRQSRNILRLSKPPFLPLFTLCFCLGIISARFFSVRFFLSYVLLWASVIFGLSADSCKGSKNEFKGLFNSDFLLFILAILTGAVLLTNTYRLPLSHIRNFTFYKSEAIVIRGRVVDFPRIEKNATSFIVNSRTLTWAGKIYPVSGKVLVRVFRRQNVSYGDELLLSGRLFRPYQSRENRFSYRRYLEDQGIYSVLSVSKDKPLEYLGVSWANPFKLAAYKLRNRFKHAFDELLNPAAAGMLSAMILGDRSQLPAQWRHLFMQTGTMHILAVSGLHVGIVAFILELLLKVLGLRRRRRYLLIIFLLLFYCLLTGARTSVIRASIMAAVFLLALLIKREPRISQTLSLAALIILAFNPRAIFNIGFQLSFISVISIVCLSPRIKNLISRIRISAILPQFLVCGFCVSLSAWLGTFILIAYYFRIIAPVTVLANLVVVPYLGLVIALGFSLLAAALLFPPLAPLFAASANLSIAIIVEILSQFSRFPAAYFYI